MYKVRFETSKGDFIIEVTRDWAPQGAARFRQLVQTRYYDGTRFFRVVPGFVVQWGLNGDPLVTAEWRSRYIADDPPRQSNLRGYVTFAKSGPNSRTTQVFINLADNPRLDGMGFSPFGKVVSGMEVVENLYSGYGDTPRQDQISAAGNAYLLRDFPQLDFIRRALIEQ